MGEILVQCDRCNNYIDARIEKYYVSPQEGILCNECVTKKRPFKQSDMTKKIFENTLNYFFSIWDQNKKLRDNV